MKNRHIPFRKCIACRVSKDKKQLIRIVKNKENEIIIDEKFKQEGRGTYICKNENCLENVVKKKMLNKIMKMQVDEEIYDKLKEIIIKN